MKVCRPQAGYEGAVLGDTEGPTHVGRLVARASADQGGRALRATSHLVECDERQGELCGHESMNGRARTGEAWHPEKNHRYG